MAPAEPQNCLHGRHRLIGLGYSTHEAQRRQPSRRPASTARVETLAAHPTRGRDRPADPGRRRGRRRRPRGACRRTWLRRQRRQAVGQLDLDPGHDAEHADTVRYTDVGTHLEQRDADHVGADDLVDEPVSLEPEHVAERTGDSRREHRLADTRPVLQ